MTDTPKPVFPAGYEPPGLTRDDYDWSVFDKKFDQAAVGRKARSVSRPVEVCWYCGDELKGKYADVSAETHSAECDYSPTGLHELEEVEGTCQACDGSGNNLVNDNGGVCPACWGTGIAESDSELWDRDGFYTGGKDLAVRNSDKPNYGLGELWSLSQAERERRGMTGGRQPELDQDWKPGGRYLYPKFREYKPDPLTWRNLPWSEWKSEEAAKSGNMFVRLYGRYRDAQQNYASCTVKRHWGPRGGAGLVPWAKAPDGKTYVLLSHRSKLVENGDTWSSFGGAIDKEDKDAFHAAVREAFEEVEGLPAEGTVTATIARPCHACGWLYTTFVIQVRPTGQVRVNRKGHSGWETQGVKWVELGMVARYNLHPGFRKSWPEIHGAIGRAA